MTMTATSNAVETAARFEAALALAPAAIEASLAAAAEGVSAVIVPAIKARTPIGKSYGEDGSTTPTGTLAASTRADITNVPEGADIAVSQPALSAPNEDGSGGGFAYVQSVVKGRKAITAPSEGTWSTGKAFLRTPWGPRKSVGASKPNDYITPALADAMPGMRAAAAEGAHAAAVAIVEALK